MPGSALSQRAGVIRVLRVENEMSAFPDAERRFCKHGVIPETAQRLSGIHNPD